MNPQIEDQKEETKMKDKTEMKKKIAKHMIATFDVKLKYIAGVKNRHLKQNELFAFPTLKDRDEFIKELKRINKECETITAQITGGKLK